MLSVGCYLLLATCYLQSDSFCAPGLSEASYLLQKKLFPFAPVVRLALVFYGHPVQDNTNISLIYFMSEPRQECVKLKQMRQDRDKTVSTFFFQDETTSKMLCKI